MFEVRDGFRQVLSLESFFHQTTVAAPVRREQVDSGSLQVVQERVVRAIARLLRFVGRGWDVPRGRDDVERHRFFLLNVSVRRGGFVAYKYERTRRKKSSPTMSCEFVSVSSTDLAGLSGLVLGDVDDENPSDTTVRLARNIDGSLVETAEAKVSVTVGERKIAPWALPWYAERDFRDAVSYVPTADQVTNILEKGNAVIEAKGDDTMMRVKIGHENGVKKYRDDAPRDPTKSAWFKLKLVTEEQKKTYETEETGFVVVPDMVAPMSETSMGMNGLLARFDGKPENRINLFVGTENDVFELMSGFLAFRCRHQDTIIEQTIEKMNEKGSKSELLDLALTVKRAAGESTTFASLGIGLRSFCQTWDPDTGEPNFSQQSPHFQTKVVIRDAARLFEVLREHEGTKGENDLCEKFKEYGDRVLTLKRAFVEKGYERSFVDLDQLYARMAERRALDDVASWILRFIR